MLKIFLLFRKNLTGCWRIVGVVGLGVWMVMGVAIAADIKVELSRNPVALNESLLVVFSAQQDPDAAPDFSALNQQFDIIDQQQSTQSSWINGKTEYRQEWRLTLMPKQAGEVLIPPIAFGRDSSKPLKLKVTEPQVASGKQDELFLEVEATPAKVYQQAQLLYTVRFYRRVQMTQARLTEPNFADAVVEQLGDDASYSTQLNGVEYAVTERKYAIFPQQVGRFDMPALSVDAEVIRHQGGHRNMWGNRFKEARRVVSKALQVEVLPIPDAVKADTWLPAEDVYLSEQWSNQALQVKVGEPLTRTITLSVKSSTVAQLPELSPPMPDGFKRYPDQPQLHEEKHPDGLWASREEKVAFIASKPGEYEFPAMAIAWFDTHSGQQQRAQLPAVKVYVQAVDGPVQAPAVPMTSETLPPSATRSSDASDAVLFWQRVALGLAVGWVLTGLMFWRRLSRSTPLPNRVVPEINAAKLSQRRATLQQACLDNQPDLARAALLNYFAVPSLAQLAELQPQLAVELNPLSRALYAQTGQVWRGENLWQAVLELEKTEHKPMLATNSDDLEPLFKIK